MNYPRLVLMCYFLIQTGLQSIARQKNSIGIQLVDVKAGTFTMGSNRGGEDADERPVHAVTITSGFKMSATEITNKQYEAFDPSHSQLRGKNGFSLQDDEAVVLLAIKKQRLFVPGYRARKENHTVCPRKQNGNMPAGPEPPLIISLVMNCPPVIRNYNIPIERRYRCPCA